MHRPITGTFRQMGERLGLQKDRRFVSTVNAAKLPVDTACRAGQLPNTEQSCALGGVLAMTDHD